MILDVARHKFYESLVTLLAIAVVAVVRGALLPYVEPTSDIAFATAPLQPFIEGFAMEYPTIVALVSMILIMHASLRLSRATVRFNIYGARTMAAMPLVALMLSAFAIYGNSLSTLIVASLTAETLHRLFYCLGHSSRPHYLFTAMLSMGAMPLVDISLLATFVLVPIILLFMHSRMRDVLVALAGVALPIFAYCYIGWCFGNEFNAAVVSLWDNMLLDSSFDISSYMTLPRLIVAGIVLFLQLCVLLLYRSERRNFPLTVRNIWSFMQFMLLMLTALFVILPSTSVASVVVVILMSAVMLPLFFLRMGEMISVISYITLFCCSIAALI